jgi:diguanylate cyclase (GGDEF)-like protein
MIGLHDLLAQLRPLHVCVGKTGHIESVGRSLKKLTAVDLTGKRFLEVFEVLRLSVPSDIAGVRGMAGQALRLRLRTEPDILLRGFVVDDQSCGVIIDLSFGIAVIDAVHRFGLTAQDFSPSDLAVEMLFLHEAKSSAMAASFNLNTRLDGARLAAESKAMTDALTGLHNRLALDNALARLGQSQTEYAVLNMDLDRFKHVNDTLGHAVGDAVLKRVAIVLRRHTRKDDLLVRAGGDEFVIICPGLTDRMRLAHLSDALIAGICDIDEIEGQDLRISASIGIGLSMAEATLPPDRVCENADIALYAAKRSGRGCHRFWTQELGASLSDLSIPHVEVR